VSVPTLYVWGSGDPALGPRAAITTGRWVTGPYRFEVIAGAGHWLPEHHAGELGRLLLAHLDGGRPGQQRREGGPAIRQGSEPGGDPPKAARRRPPGTEHGSRREEPHRRKRVGKPERPLPVSPTGSYCQAAVLS
jgi:hypothetical protein